jgi:hypothetical protein
LLGGIFGGDAGRGAAIGAGLGAIGGGARRNDEYQYLYNQAYGACMSGQQ